MRVTFDFSLKTNLSYRLLYPVAEVNLPEHVETENSYLFWDRSKQFKNELYVTLKGSELPLTFPLRIKASDIDYFIRGQYTKMSKEYKERLLSIFKSRTIPYLPDTHPSNTYLKRIEAIFDPKPEDFESLAQFLNVDARLIKSIGQLYPLVDINKEIYLK